VALMARPNAVDLRVDQLSYHDLLSRSATALVDPERQLAAQRFVHWHVPGWLLSVLLPALALAYFWQSGSAARVRDVLRQRLRNETLVRFFFGCTLGAIVQLAGLVPSFYQYRVERAMGLSDQLLHGWALEWLLGSIATMLCIGVVVALVLALADRTHQWYLYAIAAIFALSFGFAWIAPFIAAPAFDRKVPLPPRAAAIAAGVERDAGRSVPVIEQIRRRTQLGTAYVIGFGSTARIVLGDATLAVSSPAELRFIIARQLGYVADASAIKIALTDALLLIVGAGIGVGIADRIRFRRDDDAVTRLALLGALLAVLYAIAVPVDDAVLRAMDARATRYALSLGIDRAAAVRSIVRNTDVGLGEVCPDLIARTFVVKRVDPSTLVSWINGVPPSCPP
jgi:Zn-dependent protease with chaperone function